MTLPYISLTASTPHNTITTFATALTLAMAMVNNYYREEVQSLEESSILPTKVLEY